MRCALEKGGREETEREGEKRDFYIPTIQNGNSENNSIDDSTKIIKYLGINLTREAKSIH